MKRKALKMFYKGIDAETISCTLQLNLKTVQIWIWEDWQDNLVVPNGTCTK